MKSTFMALLALCLCLPLMGADKAKERPLPKGLKSLKTLAEQGDAKAQFNLGYMYDEGEGVPKNGMEAIKWYRKSAEQGQANAQYNLGWMYKERRGVKGSVVTAYTWFNIAATNRNQNAKQWKTLLARKMTPDQIAEVRELFREMVKKNPKLLGDAESSSGVLQLEQRNDGFTYKKGAQQPYTGQLTMTVPGTNEKYATSFQDGVRHGLLAVWYADGKRKANAEFNRGKLVSGITWKPNGTEGSRVVNGTGTFLMFHPDGSKARESVYENGVRIRRTDFPAVGSPEKNPKLLTPTITRLTPKRLPRSVTGFYPVEIILEISEIALRPETVEPVVLVGTVAYQMRRVSPLKNRWQTLVPIDSQAKELRYRIKVNWQFKATAPLVNSQLSPEFLLQVEN